MATAKNFNFLSAEKKTQLAHLDQKKSIEKATLRRIEINELPRKQPDFSDISATKDSTIAKWLQNWIQKGIAEGKLSTNNLLPRKQDLAKYFKVSVGTVQNSIRYIEDDGFVESKQRIGTVIRDYRQPVEKIRKQTSKRDQAIIALKKHIIDAEYTVDSTIPSSRELSKSINSTSNTTRLALEYLASVKIVESMGNRGNKANWILRRKPELTEKEIKNYQGELTTDTLVNQVERELKDYITVNFKKGDRLPAHNELSSTLKVSIKTIHDAMKQLIDEGILSSKRGRYGTTIIKLPSELDFESTCENSILTQTVETEFYNYEKVEHHLKALICKDYKVGDKLPAMNKLSEDLKVSSNTVRKALQKLADENIVKFSRGRYGGTFITAMPDKNSASAFKWLSINPEHVKVYKNKELATVN